MKRLWRLFSLFLIIVLSGCTILNSGNQTPNMYIEMAQLTEEEENILQLSEPEEKCYLYDFYLDDTVRTIQINIYELIDEKWENTLGGETIEFEDSQGRAALILDNIGFQAYLQNEDEFILSAYYLEQTEELDYYMASVLTSLQERKEIVYEQEIPLAIQIKTTQDKIHSYNVDFFFKPKLYAQHDYEHVYAITILFSPRSYDDLTFHSKCLQKNEAISQR